MSQNTTVCGRDNSSICWGLWDTSMSLMHRTQVVSVRHPHTSNEPPHTHTLTHNIHCTQIMRHSLWRLLIVVTHHHAPSRTATHHRTPPHTNNLISESAVYLFTGAHVMIVLNTTDAASLQCVTRGAFCLILEICSYSVLIFILRFMYGKPAKLNFHRFNTMDFLCVKINIGIICLSNITHSSTLSSPNSKHCFLLHSR